MNQNNKLYDRYEFRTIRLEETEQAVEIEQICFPPNEACSPEMMRERIKKAPDFFLVAVEKKSGRLAGFLNGLATKETKFRDEFFTDAALHDPHGKNIMLLGLDVLPEHRMQGVGRELVRQYAGAERKRGGSALILTCLEEKVEMYRKFGFVDDGTANSSWGGEEWHQMSYYYEKGSSTTF